jgi:preprotein translocase subunit SecD
VDEAHDATGPQLVDPDSKTVRVRPEPALSAPDFCGAAVTAPVEGKTSVSLQLTPAGAKKLARLTTDPVGQRLAIVIEGEFVMTPRILDPILGGRVLVTLNAPLAQAQQLVARIKTRPGLEEMRRVPQPAAARGATVARHTAPAYGGGVAARQSRRR